MTTSDRNLTRDEVDALDIAVRQWATVMKGRLRDGARKFGATSWRDEVYTDTDNATRLNRAVEHLVRALVISHSSEQTYNPAEVQKRAADVANQAFMLADPLRRRER